ncbi:hypothetical protein UVI_02063680 [Ustilaginoidea virens]|uniref:Alpha/beta hydrolase fold-3 domain-containing protein n=1 Tax=Ustilaginoidea virens TaxID=1159556 RepID=A0A1B5L7G5_USTVR|nr:hypothetical protein UVI_02063680 [Ustilaginoidea virens]
MRYSFRGAIAQNSDAFPGGGFCLAANKGYFAFLDSLVASSRQSNKDLAVFVLTYTLAPGAAYPTQLTQAVSALRYILKQTRRKPSQVVIGGDSAGGNMVMGVLSHLAHVHPAIPELKITEPLLGAIGIAPWTLMGQDHSKREIYHGGDLVTPAVDLLWSTAFLAGAAQDYFTSVSDAPKSWFEKFPVRQVLICGGGSEIMLPVIEDLAEKLQVTIALTRSLTREREGHVAPVYNIYVGDRTETQQGKKIKAWLRDVL